MQEIVLLLTGIAGAASAAAYRRIPKNKPRLPSIGASPRIRSQVHSLEIERDVLTRTISRLYHNDAGISGVQRDRLLSRYQHQLGVILGRIERLGEASAHPDIGPVGDGLVTLMDQKLSSLDDRLYELSSKISLAGVQVRPESAREPKASESKPSPAPKQPSPEPHNAPRQSAPLEITTLTAIPGGSPKFPDVKSAHISPPAPVAPTPAEPIPLAPTPAALTPVESARVPVISNPEPPGIPEAQQPIGSAESSEDAADGEDLNKITEDIEKILKKLDQSEVE